MWRTISAFIAFLVMAVMAQLATWHVAELLFLRSLTVARTRDRHYGDGAL
jgi:hypothetical protein